MVSSARRDGAIVDLHLEGELSLRSPNSVKRCLANLIGNARRYADHVWVQAGRRNDAIEITVDDDGPGIPASSHEDVFRPFFRLKAPQPLDRRRRAGPDDRPGRDPATAATSRWPTVHAAACARWCDCRFELISANLYQRPKRLAGAPAVLGHGPTYEAGAVCRAVAQQQRSRPVNVFGSAYKLAPVGTSPGMTELPDQYIRPPFGT